MKVPRQIIYPLDYLKVVKESEASLLETRFIEKLMELIGDSEIVVPLGRARSGVFLFVNEAIRGKKNRVVLSPFTIPDVVNMVRFAGGEPVFVDFEAGSTNVDVDQLAELLDERTACVLLTHYHVNQDRFSDIRTLCRRRGVFLFEDCAISLGGTIDGIPVGMSSDGGVISLSAFKFLNYFWGGVLFTANEELGGGISGAVGSWKRLRPRDYRGQAFRTLRYDLSTRSMVFRLLTGPMLRSRQRRAQGPIEPKVYRIESESFDGTLMTRPSASALHEWLGKFDRVTEQLARRRSIARVYDRFLGGLMVSSESRQAIKDGSCFVNYPIFLPHTDRDRIYKQLLAEGFDVGLAQYPNAHAVPAFVGFSGYSSRTNELVERVLTLPTHPRTPSEYAYALGERIRALL